MTDTCDPAAADWLCWTGAEMQFGWALIVVCLFGLGLRGIIRSHQSRLRNGLPPKGATPDRNDTLIFARESPLLGLGNGNADAARPYRVTRDPQLYAKAFVPSTHKKKDLK